MYWIPTDEAITFPLMDTFEGYHGNQGWFFFAYLDLAADLCQSSEYIERKHPNKRKVKVNIGKNDKIKERVAVRKV